MRIHVTSHGRTYDLTNPRDRRTLQEDGTDAEYESGKLSTRAKRHTTANAVDGRPHGRIPFGYRRTYDPTNGRLAGQEPEPAEAAVVVEMFERLAQGHSLRSVARDFEARGIRHARASCSRRSRCARWCCARCTPASTPTFPAT